MVRSASLILAVGLVAVSASSASADGWKAFTDKKGKCTAQVPASWGPGEFGLGMVSPGGKSDAAISVTALDLAGTKATADSTFTVESVVENSSKRYWIVFADRVGKPIRHQYVAVPGHGFTCAFNVDYDRAVSEDDVKTMMQSLRPK